MASSRAGEQGSFQRSCWVGNSRYAWTIPEEDLCYALYEISSCIGDKNRMLREFEVGTYTYELVSFFWLWETVLNLPLHGPTRLYRGFTSGRPHLAQQKSLFWWPSSPQIQITRRKLHAKHLLTINSRIHALSMRTLRAKTILEHFYQSISCTPLPCI